MAIGTWPCQGTVRSWLFLGVAMVVIAANLSGSAFIPCFVMMLPINLTSSSLNCSFIGFNFMFSLRQCSISVTK